jgi:site-specific recombinase XerD
MDAPTLATLADLYLLRCEVEGKSPGTVRAYRETVTRFLRLLPDDAIQADHVRADHIYVYLGAFTGHSLETRHRYFREVRCFFSWLVELDYLERSPFRGMKNVRLPQRIVEPFSGLQIEALLTACGDEAISLRDRALVLVLLDTGARCSEIVQLNLEDLDVEACRLRILHGKGNKQRVVPFADRCAAALGDYLAERGEQPGPLFVAGTPRRASAARLEICMTTLLKWSCSRCWYRVKTLLARSRAAFASCSWYTALRQASASVWRTPISTSA